MGALPDTINVQMPSAARIAEILERMKMRESSGRVTAKGKKGEIGLYQIMPRTARRYGITEEALKDPRVNRWVAEKYLRELLHTFHGDIGKALEAYNAGPGRIRSGYVPEGAARYARDILGTPIPARAGRLPVLASWAPDWDRSPNTLEIPSRWRGFWPHATTAIPTTTPSTRRPTTIPAEPTARPNVQATPTGYARMPLPRIRSAWEPTIPLIEGQPQLQRLGHPPPAQLRAIFLNTPLSAIGGRIVQANGQPFPDQSITVGEALERGGIERGAPRQPPALSGQPMSALDRAMEALASTGEGTAYAEEPPPLPPGVRDLTPSRAVPALPSGVRGLPATQARTPSRAERFLNLLPAAGQIGGEVTVPMLGEVATEGGATPALMALKTLGGAIGTGIGEEARLGARRLLGMPADRSQAEILKSAAISGAISALPLDRLLGALAPGRRIAAGAARGFRAAGHKAEELWETTAGLLGVGRGEAQRQLASPVSARAFKATVGGIRRAGFDALSQGYQQVLGPFSHRQTPNEIINVLRRELGRLRAFQKELPGDLRTMIAKTDPAQAKLGVPFQRMTIDYEQRVLSALKEYMRSLPADEKRVMAGSVDRLIAAGEQDIERTLVAAGHPESVAAYRELNRRWMEMVQQFPGRRMQAIARSPNVSKAGRLFFGGPTSRVEESQLGEAFRIADTLPTQARDSTYRSLREAYGATAYDYANRGAITDFQRMANIRNYVLATSDNTLVRLYGKHVLANKAVWADTLTRAEEQFGRLAQSPNMRAAVEREIDRHLAQHHGLLEWLKHRGVWELTFAGAAGFSMGGLHGGEAGIIVAGGGAAILSFALRTRSGMAVYRQLAYGKTPEAMGRAIVGVLDAAMSEEARQGEALAKTTGRT